jgi:cation:H+ antiporter
MTYALLAAGLVVLLGGGELLVRGAVGLAERLGVSPLVIGLTVVGFGTSMPELVACIEAVLAGAPGIAIGNVVGSNIANVLLILGVGAALRPLVTHRRSFQRDGPVLLAATVLLVALCQYEVIGREAGGIAVACLLAYLLYSYWAEGRLVAAGHSPSAEGDAAAIGGGSLPLALLATAIGIAGVLIGARLLVLSAIELARLWEVSEAVIGLTLVAIGTSLPELATVAAAAWRNQGDVAFGNIVGSNIFNSLGIIGVTALVQPIAVPAAIARVDVWVMLGVAGILVVFAITGWRVSRSEGFALLLAYAAYLTYLALA